MNDLITFDNVIKKSVINLEAFRSVSYIDMLFGFTCAFAIGIFIFWIYRRYFRGVVYSYNYNVSFVLMTLITAMIIMTISTNIVLSLGMVGALSIVRFRTAVKDPLDIVYMFWAISAGIASGAKMYPLAIIGSLFIGAVLAVLSKRKVYKHAYLLIIRHSEEAADPLRNELRKMTTSLKSKNVRKGYTELTLELSLRDDNTSFMKKLNDIEGVMEVSLINYTGDYAQ